MTELEKNQLELNIIRIETRIDSYKRIKERTEHQAFTDSEYGYRESAQFNKGQQFVLEYVIEDLEIVLEQLKTIIC